MLDTQSDSSSGTGSIPSVASSRSVRTRGSVSAPAQPWARGRLRVARLPGPAHGEAAAARVEHRRGGVALRAVVEPGGRLGDEPPVGVRRRPARARARSAVGAGRPTARRAARAGRRAGRAAGTPTPALRHPCRRRRRTSSRAGRATRYRRIAGPSPSRPGAEDQRPAVVVAPDVGSRKATTSRPSGGPPSTGLRGSVAHASSSSSPRARQTDRAPIAEGATKPE